MNAFFYQNIALLGIMTILILGCKTTKNTGIVNYPSGEVIYMSDHSERNVIALQSKGYGKNYNEAIIDAEKRAVEQLLYRGVANSSSNLPILPISGVSTAQKNQIEQYFRELAYRKHLTYIQRSEVKDRDKPARMVISEVMVKIDLLSLRRDMEQLGIIPKFGL